MTRQFKINMVSDRDPTQEEFNYLQSKNSTWNYSADECRAIRERIDAVMKFQYDTNKMEQLILEQTFNKIRQRNFSGLNVTQLKMMISGDLALAE